MANEPALKTPSSKKSDNATAEEFETFQTTGDPSVPAPTPSPLNEPIILGGDNEPVVVSTAPAKSGKPADSTNMLSAFQKSVGDKTSSNVAQVGMKYGQYLSALKGGTNKSAKSIARTVENGHHTAAANVLKQYAIQGKKPSKKLTSLIDQLDNLAAHSIAVGAMDDRTRVQMIGEGHRALDAQVINAQEQSILQQIQTEAGEVFYAEDRLDFAKKQAELVGKRISNEQALLDYNDDVEGKKRIIALESLTNEQLQQALTGKNETGIPIGFISTEYNQRITEQAAISKQLASVKKTDVEAMQTVLNNIDPKVLTLMQEEALKQNAEGKLIASVQIPGTEHSVTQQQIGTALEATKGLRGSEADMKTIRKNRTLGHGLTQRAQQFSDNFGIEQSSPIFSDFITKVGTLLSADARDVSEEALTAAQKSLEDMEKNYLNTIVDPAQKDAARHRMQFGRYYDNRIATDSLVTRSPEDIEAATVNKPLYQGVAQVIQALQAQNVRNRTDSVGGLASFGLEDTSKKGKESFNPLREPFDNKRKMAAVSEMATAELSEQFYAGKANAMITQLEEMVATEEFIVQNPEAAVQVRDLVESYRQNFFGDNPNPMHFSNATDPNLVVPQPVIFSDLDKDGNKIEVPLLDADGNPVNTRATNFAYVMDKIDTFEKEIQALGIDFDATKVFLHDNTETILSSVADANRVENSTQEELLMASNKTYANNTQITDSRTILSNNIKAIHENVINSRDFDFKAFEETGSLLQKASGLIDTLGPQFFAETKRGVVKDLLAKRGYGAVSGRGAHIDAANKAKMLEAETAIAEEVNGMSVSQLFEAGYVSKSQLLEYVKGEK